MGISGDSVFGQVRFQIAIRSSISCQNGIDDDGDTLIDYPSDPGCSSLSDTSELSFSGPLTGVCYPLVTTATVGQIVTWVVSADNGIAPFSYNWSGTDGLSGSLSVIQRVYTSPGTKTATVIITSDGVSSPPIVCSSSVVISNTGGG